MYRNDTVNNSMLINLIHYPLYTLGIGRRIGIWTQGCSIRCNNCISRHSWNFDDKYKRAVSEIIDDVKKILSKDIDVSGLTFSGGEPFDQSDALFLLLKDIRKIGINDIMVYSGYHFDILEKSYSHILSYIDALVDGNFIKGLNTSHIWKGSDNQKLHILTIDKLLRKKYEEYEKIMSERRELQIIQSGDKIFILGIPKQEDMEVIKNGII